MQLFFQLTIDGVTMGAIYATLALALVLVHRSTRIVNFGQGEMATFCAFLAWQFMQWGWPAWAAFPVVAVIAFVLGAVVFRAVIRPLLGAPVESVVIATLGIFMCFLALTQWVFGSDQREFYRLFPDGAWTMAQVRVTTYAAGVLACVAAIALASAALFRYTKVGLGMRAAAAEREKSPLVGIRVERMLMLGWGLSALIGFVAAVLVTPKLFLSPTMMLPVLLYSLAAATLGGWDSPMGAIVGGLVVGVAESLLSTFVAAIGAELRLAVPIILMFLVLMIKPVGLFGRLEKVRV